MIGKKTITLLIAILTFIAIVIATVAIGIIHSTTLTQQRSFLETAAKSQAALIASMAEFDAQYNQNLPLSVEEATLGQLLGSRLSIDGFGETGEFVLAVKEGNFIRFLLPQRNNAMAVPSGLALDVLYGKVPYIVKGFDGHQSVMTALDYRGVEVLAAAQPVGTLGLVLVAKVDMAEIDAPFIRAGLIIAMVTVFAVACGAFLFKRTTMPMIDVLANHEEKMRVILDNALIGIFSIDETGVIQTANKSAAEIFGYEVDDLVGQDVSILVPSDRQMVHKEHIQRFTTTESTGFLGFSRELEGMRKNGDVFPVKLAISRVKSGNQSFFTAIVRDITVEKSLSTETLQARVLAESANQAKSEFLSSMSHELRTPLNSILGFAQLINESPQFDAKSLKDFSGHILSAGNHLLELINEVLDLAKVEAGKLSLTFKEINPDTLIKDACQLVATLAKEKRLELINQSQSPLPLVYCDPLRLRQLLLNLLSNAIKYNDRGKCVSVEATEIDGFVRFSIVDDGPGIALEKQDLVFQPFARLGRESSAVAGSGIGLALSKRLIEEMGGSIGFESDGKTGTTFWIDVPIAKSVSQPQELLVKQNPEAIVQPLEGRSATVCHICAPGARCSILYIEDDPMNVKLMQSIVHRIADVELISIPNAEHAISFARKRPPKLIIADINLPGMNGRELSRQLQKITETAKVPRIAISGDVMEASCQAALDAGFDKFLAKPINIQQLEAVIRSYLGLPGSALSKAR